MLAEVEWIAEKWYNFIKGKKSKFQWHSHSFAINKPTQSYSSYLWWNRGTVNLIVIMRDYQEVNCYSEGKHQPLSG